MARAKGAAVTAQFEKANNLQSVRLNVAFTVHNSCASENELAAD